MGRVCRYHKISTRLTEIYNLLSSHIRSLLCRRIDVGMIQGLFLSKKNAESKDVASITNFKLLLSDADWLIASGAVLVTRWKLTLLH